jgi:hypothetical protein
VINVTLLLLILTPSGLIRHPFGVSATPQKIFAGAPTLFARGKWNIFSPAALPDESVHKLDNVKIFQLRW